LLGSRGFWITWTVLAAITLTLTLGAHRTATYPGDVRLARAIQSLDVPLIGGILHSENTIGNPWPAVTIIVAVTLVLLVIRHATLRRLVRRHELLARRGQRGEGPGDPAAAGGAAGACDGAREHGAVRAQALVVTNQACAMLAP